MITDTTRYLHAQHCRHSRTDGGASHATAHPDFLHSMRYLQGIAIQQTSQQERMDKIGDQIRIVRKISSELERVEKYYQEFVETQHNSDALLKAIRILKSILEENSNEQLPDNIRVDIEQKQKQYKQRYDTSITNYRNELLREADIALNQLSTESLKLALGNYLQIRDKLSSEQQDADAEAGINRVYERFQILCNHLVDETESLLNINHRRLSIGQIGIETDEVCQLLGRVIEAEQATELQKERPTDLYQAESDLRKAKNLCETVEKEIKTIKERWLQARREGENNFDTIKSSLQPLRRNFERENYIHASLDPNSLTPLEKQIEKDEGNHKRAIEAYKKIREILNKVGEWETNTSNLKEAFTELFEAEQAIEKTSQLSFTSNPFEHRKDAYPRMYSLLSDMVNQNEQINSQVKEERNVKELIELLRRHRGKRELLSSLLSEYDPDNKFGFRVQSNYPITLDEIEGWATLYLEGLNHLQEAERSENNGKKNFEEKRWQQAKEELSNSRKYFEGSLKKLEWLLEQIASQVQNTEYSAVKHMQEHATNKVREIKGQIERFDRNALLEKCEQKQKEALQLLREADDHLRKENCDDALHKVDEAVGVDPILDNDDSVRRIRSLAKECIESKGGRWIVFAVILLLLFILIVAVAVMVFWPAIIDFLFPSGIIFFS